MARSSARVTLLKCRRDGEAYPDFSSFIYSNNKVVTVQIILCRNTGEVVKNYVRYVKCLVKSCRL